MLKFVENVFKISFGTLLAQVIGVITMPVITRLYSPESFGHYGIFNSMTMLIATIASMRYEVSILLPKTEKKASVQFYLSILLIVVFNVVLLIILFVFRTPLMELFNISDFKNLVLLVPLMVVFYSGYQVFKRWLSRKKRFGVISKSLIYQRFFSQGLMIGIGFIGYRSAFMLIASKIIGQVISFSFLLKNIVRNDNVFTTFPSCKAIKRGAIKYRNFPLFSLWSALFNTAAIQLPVILLGIYFSSSVVAYYSLSNMILGIPMMLIGQAIGQVFFQKIAEGKENGKIENIIKIVYKYLVYFTLLPFILLTFNGEKIFLSVFGQDWIETSLFIQILSLPFFFSLISSSMNSIIDVFNRQRLGMIWSIIFFVLRIIVIFIGGSFFDVNLTILIFGIVSGISYLTMVLVLLSISGISLSYTFSVFLKALIMCVPVVLLFWFLSNNVGILSLLLSIAGLAIHYLFLFYYNFFRKNVWNN